MKKTVERKKLTKSIFLLLVMSAFLILNVSCDKKQKAEMKTSNYWTSPTMTLEQAKELAQHDIVVADMENAVNNRESLLLMKSINEDIILLAYSNPMETWSIVPGNRPIQSAWAAEIKSKYPQWLLKTGSGLNSVFWPGMIMLNMSTLCPQANTEYGLLRYNQWVSRKLVEQVLVDPVWTGHYTDNCTPNVSWIRRDLEQIDIDGDGISDTAEAIDRAWEDGMRNFLNNLRANTGEGFLLFGNKGVLNFVDLLDGIMFENFPNNYLGSKINGGFDQCIINTEMMTMGNVRYVIFHAKEEDLEFVLASSLLFDYVYVAVGQDNTSFPELLKLSVGKPVSDRTQTGAGIWFRDFEKLSVEVYPPGRRGEVRPIEKGLGEVALQMGVQ